MLPSAASTWTRSFCRSCTSVTIAVGPPARALLGTRSLPLPLFGSTHPFFSVFSHHFSNMREKRELVRIYLSMCVCRKLTRVTGGLPHVIFHTVKHIIWCCFVLQSQVSINQSYVCFSSVTWHKKWHKLPQNNIFYNKDLSRKLTPMHSTNTFQGLLIPRKLPPMFYQNPPFWKFLSLLKLWVKETEMSFLGHSKNVPEQTRGWLLQGWAKEQHQKCWTYPITESESASKQSP